MYGTYQQVCGVILLSREMSLFCEGEVDDVVNGGTKQESKQEDGNVDKGIFLCSRSYPIFNFIPRKCHWSIERSIFVSFCRDGHHQTDKICQNSKFSCKIMASCPISYPCDVMVPMATHMT